MPPTNKSQILDNIFGTQAPSANRPSLDSILGVTSKPKSIVETTSTPENKEIVKDIVKTAKKEIVDPFTDRLSKIDYANQNFMSNGLQTTGAAVGGGFDVFLNGLKGAAQALLPESIETAISTQTKRLIEAGAAKLADVIPADQLKGLQDTATAHPELAGDINALFEIGLPKGLKDTAEIVEKSIKATEAFKATKASGEAILDATGNAVTAPFKATRDFTVGLKDKVVKKAEKGEKAIMNKADSVFGKADEIAEVSSSPEVHPFIAKSPENTKIIADAVKQGFQPKEIKFLTTISDADKPALKEMTDLAETGSSDLRAQYAGKRPADVVGDSTLAPLREIQKLNSKSGADVDATARALSGTKVDATPVGTTANSILEKAGVTVHSEETYQKALADAVTAGKPYPSRYSFDESVFKKLPGIQKQLNNALSDLPTGEIDAYDLHKFKKSIDQIVEYGKSSDKPMTREAENILKEIRASADEVLDTNFPEYNKANTDFKTTRDVLDKAHDVMGSKVDFLASSANMSVGNRMRRLFSNTDSRAQMFDFLKQLTDTSGQYGIKLEQSPVDQALYAQVLESIYGTPAITGIQGETGKAIKTAMDFATNPTGTMLAKGMEALNKMGGASPEEKKRILRLFIENNAVK